jgi:hypothetical protein
MPGVYVKLGHGCFLPYRSIHHAKIIIRRLYTVLLTELLIKTAKKISGLSSSLLTPLTNFLERSINLMIGGVVG